MLSLFFLTLTPLLLSLPAYSQSDLFSNFPRTDANTTGSCGACQIVFFPYLVAWNESTQSHGSYDNVTVVAPVLVTIDNSTNITSTQTMSAETGLIVPNGGPAVKTFNITVGNGSPVTTSTAGDFIFSTVITSPTALIWWGAWSVQGLYQTTDSTGGSICTISPQLNTIASTGLPVPFTSMTTYPTSAYPEPYTGTPVPTSSFSDVPFGTAEAEAFLELFPTISAFASCIPISYSGAPALLTRANGFLTTSYTHYTTFTALQNQAASESTSPSAPSGISLTTSAIDTQFPASFSTTSQRLTASSTSLVPSTSMVLSTVVVSPTSTFKRYNVDYIEPQRFEALLRRKFMGRELVWDGPVWDVWGDWCIPLSRKIS
ncbi:MAG: hypothetical protein FRX48_06980 [Lasallia pustulata]|uniref:Uncharacterized protein n=1 Tax=Lasallia pustulata TaxID=136370 RepID=A0A5M8PJ96_9LECA|nr:MAG: hypothetical protein FRX48_06980 [Lasallia pustulata]